MSIYLRLVDKSGIKHMFFSNKTPSFKTIFKTLTKKSFYLTCKTKLTSKFDIPNK